MSTPAHPLELTHAWRMTSVLRRHEAFGGVQRILTAFATWMRRQEAACAMESMSDHMLRDIGVRRHEIRRAVHGRL